jgi:hypothetical protein
MTSSKDISYLFERNSKGSLRCVSTVCIYSLVLRYIRLNFNRFHMTRLTGSLLHSKVPVDHENLAIADIGTGTG